jgi:hypothetical protein
VARPILCRCGAPATHIGSIGPVCCNCFQEEFDHCSNLNFDPRQRPPIILEVKSPARKKPSESVRHLFAKTPPKSDPEIPG